MKFGVGCNPGALLEGKHRFRSHCREDYATVISMRFRALHFEVTVPGGEQAVGVGVRAVGPTGREQPADAEVHVGRQPAVERHLAITGLKDNLARFLLAIQKFYAKADPLRRLYP